MSVNSPPAPLPGKNNRPGSPDVNDPSAPRPNSPRNPSSRPNTPGPVVIVNGNALGKKSATKYLENVKQEDAYIQALQKQAFEAWKTKGPLCDSEGFYQHSGECWNDAIQQILCNADGVKEIVQSVYVYWTFDTEHYKGLPDWFFIPPHLRYPGVQETFLEENKEWIHELKKWMNLYFRESQKRFLRHYLLEAKRRTLKQELCAVEGPELGALAREKIRAISMNPEFRKGGVEAQQAAIFGKYTNIEKGLVSKNRAAFEFKPTREEYVAKNLAGGSDTDDEYIFNIYNAAFFNNTLSITTLNKPDLKMASLDIPTFKTFLDSVTGIHFVISKYKVDKSGNIKKSAHALAFYQCGQQELFYEDNYGIFPFEWRHYIVKFVELIRENQEPTMEFTTLHLRNKAQGLFFYTSFCPVLTYTDSKDKKRHTLLFVGNTVLETNPDSKLTYTFQTELDGTHIKLEYDGEKVWNLDRFLCIQPVITHPIADSEFELNSLSRIQMSPILQEILHRNEEGALDAIDTEKVNPGLFYRKEGEGNIPVILLAMRLDLPNVALKLIEKGYDIKAKAIDGNTALEQAIYYEYPEIVAALIRVDPSLLSYRNKHGGDPVSMASFDDDMLPSTKILVDAGAPIDSRTDLGRTPLFFASREGAIETVKYLCSKGANPLTKDTGVPPQTPIDVAKTAEIKEILMKQCGKTGGRRRRMTRRVQRKHKGKKTRRQ
jgi:uncharacterized protein